MIDILKKIVVWLFQSEAFWAFAAAVITAKIGKVNAVKLWKAIDASARTIEYLSIHATADAKKIAHKHLNEAGVEPIMDRVLEKRGLLDARSIVLDGRNPENGDDTALLRKHAEDAIRPTTIVPKKRKKRFWLFILPATLLLTGCATVPRTTHMTRVHKAPAENVVVEIVKAVVSPAEKIAEAAGLIASPVTGGVGAAISAIGGGIGSSLSIFSASDSAMTLVTTEDVAETEIEMAISRLGNDTAKIDKTTVTAP